MNLVYDITVLGVAATNERARTGVFRVVDNVARYLTGCDDLNLSWSAFGHYHHMASVRRLLHSGRLENRPLVGSSGRFRCVHALNYGYALTDAALGRLARTRIGPVLRPQAPLRPFHRALERQRAREFLSARDLRDVDVLHSAFYPLPECSRGVRGLIRFLTVYDLIPLKFPHLFSFGEENKVRRAIDELTPQDWVVCISHATRRDLLEYRPDLEPNRVRVTHLGTCDSFFHCDDPARLSAVRSKIGLPAGAPYFLSLCTLEPRKNLGHVVQAFADVLQETDGEPYLVLVGARGWQFDGLLEAVSRLGRDRIIVTGFLPDEDLSPLYTGAVAFVYMSQYEGFGLPPLEAMRCGAPVITSDNSSLPEVVGDAGVMLPAGDRDGLVAAMVAILDDPQRRAMLAKAASVQAARFTWERCGQETVKAYCDAVAARA